jgi:hypothetical protein
MVAKSKTFEAPVPLFVIVIFITAWPPVEIVGSSVSKFTVITAGAGVSVDVTVGVSVEVFVAV